MRETGWGRTCWGPAVLQRGPAVCLSHQGGEVRQLVIRLVRGM